MTDLADLAEENAKRWREARLVRRFDPVAQRLLATKSRYARVQALTGVPWPIIAVIHERESSQDFARSLAQGDPWDKVSVHVPAGRGPFQSWEAAAFDALASCPPYLARNKDWSIGSALAHLEAYNGLGYCNRHVASPYIWAGTDQYSSGKYVRDGFYDPNAVDPQLGCAGLIKALMAIDPTISFTGAVLTPIAPQPNPTAPAPGFLAALITAILSIFKRK